jgi:hypothetical protein
VRSSLAPAPGGPVTQEQTAVLHPTLRGHGWPSGYAGRTTTLPPFPQAEAWLQHEL